MKMTQYHSLQATNEERDAIDRSRLLTDGQVKSIREALPKQSWLIEYGTLEFVVATGRAKCRACGKKIAKGERCLRFAWDFHACGSFTAQTVHMHEQECK
jgi:hypothetical protein